MKADDFLDGDAPGDAASFLDAESFLDEAPEQSLRERLSDRVSSGIARMQADSAGARAANVQSIIEQGQELPPDRAVFGAGRLMRRPEGDHGTGPMSSETRTQLEGEFGEATREVAINRMAATAGAPRNKSLEKVGKAKSAGEAWDAFMEDPLNIILDVSAESLPQMAKTLAGAVAGGVALGPAGAILGGFGPGYAANFDSKFMERLEEMGFDTSNPEDLALALRSPEIVADATEAARKYGAVVGGVEAGTMGLAAVPLAPAKIAGRTLSPLSRQAINLPAQTAAQGLAGAGGEAGGQVAEKGRITSPGEVLLEGVAEGISAPVDVAFLGATALRGRRQDADMARTVQKIGQAETVDEAIRTAAQILDEGVAFSQTDVDLGRAEGAYLTELGQAEARGAREADPGLEFTPPADAKPLYESDVSGSVAGEGIISGAMEGVVGRAARSALEEPAYQQLEAQRDAERARILQSARESGLPPSSPDDLDLIADSAAAAPEKPVNPQMREAWGRVLLERMEAMQQQDSGISDVQNRQEPAVTIDARAHEAAPSPKNPLPEPSDAQKVAGNYKLGHARVGGMDVSIENPEGSERRGKSADGTEWSTKMKSHYGYVRGTVGFDKDHVDVFVKPGTTDDWHGTVYVVNQNKPGGKFDEHKAMIGFESEAEARAAYLQNYDKGWEKNIRSIAPVPREFFKAWAGDKGAFGPKSGELKAPTILGKPVDQMTRKSLEVASLRAKTRAQRIVAQAELDRRAAAPLSPAETQRREQLRTRALAARQIDPKKDSILAAVAKLGGINPAERLDILGDDKANKGYAGVGYLFSKSGTGSDDMATRLGQYGYLTKAELDSVDGGVQALKDKIADEFAGRRRHFSVGGDQAFQAEAARRADIEEEMAQAAQAAAAEAGADIDLAVTPESIAESGEEPTGEALARDELQARVVAIDPAALDMLMEQYDAKDDSDYMAAVVKWLADHEHHGSDEAQRAAGEEAGAGSRVSAEDRAPAQAADEAQGAEVGVRPGPGERPQGEGRGAGAQSVLPRDAGQRSADENARDGGGARPEAAAPAVPAAAPAQEVTQDPAQRKREFEEHTRQIRERRQNIAAQITRLLDRDGGARAERPGGGSVLLTKNLSGDAPYRVTSFLEDGTPSGHREYGSIDGSSIDGAVSEFTSKDLRIIDDGAAADGDAKVSPLHKGATDETLLCIACSDTKLDTASPVPMHELYTGPMWQSLKTHRGALPWDNVVVLSGKYGLVPATKAVATYNERITPAKVDEVIRQGLAPVRREVSAQRWKNVLIVGGEEYRRAFNAIVGRMQRGGMLAQDVVIREVQGGIGEQRSQLGTWLQEVNQKDEGLFGEQPKAGKAVSAVDALRGRMTIFASGMSRPKDMQAAGYAVSGARSGGVGVEAKELSEEGTRQLAQRILDWNLNAFVDSGAFGVFRLNMKSREKAKQLMLDVFGKQTEPREHQLSFKAVLDKYDALLDAISEANEAEVEDYPRPLLVMPDEPGNQRATLEHLESHKDWIVSELKMNRARLIIALQKGELDLPAMYRRVVEMLGTDRFIVGIPSVENVVSTPELIAFLKDVKPKRLHFLGAADADRLSPRLQAVIDAGVAEDLEHLSADANVLRSKVGRVLTGDRDELVRKVVDPLVEKERREEIQRDAQERPALELSTQTEADLKAKDAQAQSGKVEEKTAAVRDRDTAILTAPEGTAPPASVAEQKVPTQQEGLFGTAVSALREAADKIEKAAGSAAAASPARRPPTPVIDDELLDLAAAETKASKHRWIFESDAQGNLVGEPRQLDNRINRGEFTLEDVARDFERTREFLRERYGDTLTLFRADAPAKERHPKTLTAYFGDEALAKKFENDDRKALPYAVAVDDIVAVHARRSGYYEFIVKKPPEGFTPLRAMRAPKGEKPATERGTAPGEKLTDVGENLWANRRNFTRGALEWDTVKDLNDALKVKEVVKAKVWPKPNYEQLVAEGMQPFFARMLKQVYDGISTTPAGKSDAELQRYIDVVGRVREAVFAWAKDNNANREFLSQLAERAKTMAGAYRGIGTSLTSMLDGPNLRDVILDKVWPMAGDRRGVNQRFARGSEALEEIRALGGNRALRALQFTVDDAVEAMKDIEKGWPTPQEAWQRQGYEIVKGEDIKPRYHEGKRTSGDPYVHIGMGMPGRRREIFEQTIYGAASQADETVQQVVRSELERMSGKYLVLDKRGQVVKVAPTEEEAKAAARELVKRDPKGGGEIRGMNVSQAERTGPERRKEGENVTPERLMAEFGFRGVNFGREGWINQAERQAYVNGAYDALLDLAEVLGIPPKALSLNGMLGIAFGAQGRGGNAAAHFVPGHNEINLTKTMGAGTLAHEWGHALDHYFAVQGGLAKSDEPYLSAHARDFQHRMDVRKARQESVAELRPEIAAAFKTVLTAMKERPMTEAEVQARETMSKNMAVKRLEDWLAHFRKDIERSDKSRLEKFEALADRLRKGDLGSGYVKMGQQQLPEVVALIKALVKDMPGTSTNVASNWTGLENNARALAYKLAQKEATQEHIPQTTMTAYAADSMRKDGNKGGKKYWATPWEMFARAFETWVAAKLEGEARSNTFLSDASLRAESRDREGGYAMPYPRGEDRERINAAITKLVEAIETRETDRGVGMFSRVGAGGLSAERVQSIVTPILQKWGNAPDVQVIDSMAQAPKPMRDMDEAMRSQGAQGAPEAFIYRDTVYLVAEGLAEGKVEQALLHESFGHFGLRGTLGNRIVPVLDEVAKAMPGRVKAKASEYGLDFDQVDERRMAAEEVLAEMAQKMPQAGFVKRAIAAVRAFLRELGIDLELSANDILVNFILPARGFVERGRAASVDLSPAFGRDAPWYFSALERSVRDLKQGAAPAAQWKATIKALKGVTKDELEWTGVNEWLDTREGRVTKDELLGFLAQSGVKVSETVLGDKPEASKAEITAAINALSEEYVEWGQANGFRTDVPILADPSERPLLSADEMFVAYNDILTDEQRVYLENFIRRHEAAQDGTPEIDRILVDLDAAGFDIVGEMNEGGVGFQERGGGGVIYHDRPEAAVEGESAPLSELRPAVRAMALRYLELARQGAQTSKEARTKFGRYTLPGGENYRELLLTLPSDTKPAERGTAYYRETSNDFRSSHFDEPNILAHVRFNERTDAEGKKVLFIEEIQSDWAQKGKRQGFRGQAAQELPPELVAVQRQGRWQVIRESDGRPYGTGATTREAAIADALDVLDSSKIPSAPFVTKTEAWTGLALKRMIHWAAQNGFERIAWTSGDQQADRYDLSKHISRVKVTPFVHQQHGPLFEVKAYQHDNNRVINRDVPENELADTIGKELADRVVRESEGKRPVEYSGLDLKVGGEGMKAFYDKIVPNVANDILKKLGGARVAPVIIPGVSETSTRARTYMVDGREKIASEQPGFDLTPEMRAKALGGLPMFHRAYHGSPHDFDKFNLSKIGTGEGAQSYGWGLYFAGKKEVAEYYRTSLAGADDYRQVLVNGASESAIYNGAYPLQGQMTQDEMKHALSHVVYYVRLFKDPEQGLAEAKKIAEQGDLYPKGSEVQAARKLFESARVTVKPDTRRGKMYEVELAPKEDEYLDWDKPLSEQSDKVKAALKKVPDVSWGDDSWSGGTFYTLLSKELGRPKENLPGWMKKMGVTAPSPEDASKALREAGIPGIKYLDGSSRSKGEGAYNYVIFDDALVKIEGAFARGGPAPATGATAQGHPASWNVDQPGKLDTFIRVMQDKHVDSKRVLTAIRNASGALQDATDVYLQEELFHGRAAKGVNEFLDRELKPLLTDMAARKVDMREFEEYLHARHAEERNRQIASVNPQMPDGGSGMDTADAQAYLAQLDPAKLRAFQALAVRVDAINAKTRQEMVAYGLESPQAIQAWEAAYQAYVPLQREDMDGGMGTGQGFSVRGAQKRATGSKRAVVDILANIALQRERAIVRGEKNRVANALVGLATANPSPDFWRVDQPPQITYIDERTGLVARRPDPTFKSRENVIVARIPDPSGEVIEHAVIFNEHDERASRMVEALKNLDVQDLGEVLGWAGKVTRYFASINTQYNPIFGVVNLVRDTQGALFNLTTTPIAGKQKEVLGHAITALRGIYIDSRDQRKGMPARSSWAQLWEEFQTTGGQTGYRDMFATSKDRADAIRREIKKVTEGKALQFGRGVFDWLSDYNTAMENAVRLAAYKVGVDDGMTKERAASMAKNLTVNFNRRGQVGTQAGSLYAFFNASVQGTARLAETLKGPKGKQIIAGGILLGSMQALLLAAMGFDEDEPPEFVRERNLIIPIGGKKYVTIPMPLGLHILPNLGRIPTEYVLGGFRDGQKRVLELVGVFAEAFNPVGNAGISIQTLAPTAIDPIAALSENRDWTGKPIARKDFNALNPTPGHTRAKDTASEFSKAVSKALNYLSGGSAYRPGIFSPTPDQIDYLVGQVTGGLGREALKVEQTVTSAFTGEELPTYKIPLLGRFYGSSEGQAPQANTFYDNLRKLNEHENEVKGRAKAGEPVQPYLDANPEARMIRHANKAERDISKLRKRRREMLERNLPKEQIKAIDEAITGKMRVFNEAVREARE